MNTVDAYFEVFQDVAGGGGIDQHSHSPKIPPLLILQNEYFITIKTNYTGELENISANFLHFKVKNSVPYSLR